jgi:hypothetical protein
MENFIIAIAEDPLLYIGYLLSAAAAVGVLLFAAGFSGGIKHLFTYSEDADHMEHARTRSLWGLYLCMAVLGVWESIRVLVGEAPPSTLILVIILLSPIWIPLLKGLFTSDSNGH